MYCTITVTNGACVTDLGRLSWDLKPVLQQPSNTCVFGLLCQLEVSATSKLAPPSWSWVLENVTATLVLVEVHNLKRYRFSSQCVLHLSELAFLRCVDLTQLRHTNTDLEICTFSVLIRHLQVPSTCFLGTGRVLCKMF
jgi:hypothetical protein